MINSAVLLYAGTFLYFVCAVFFCAVFAFADKRKKPKLVQAGFYLYVLCLCISILVVALRWVEAAHIPLANTYETLLVFTAALSVSYFFWQKSDGERYLLATLCAIACICGAGSTLIQTAPANLPPALQNAWLTFHVITNIIAYAAFTLAFAAACFSFFNKKEALHVLQKLIYRSILFGTLFLTFGIVSGAVWADHAWGRYWSWDPKETWALICWLYYILFLHLKSRNMLQPRALAVFAACGFAVVIFTFFGVNYLLGGLHSYN